MARPLLVAVAVAVVAVVAIPALAPAGIYSPPRPVSLDAAALVAVSNLPLALRRRAPVAVLLVCCAGATA